MIQPWLERELREALTGYGALLPERITQLCQIELNGLPQRKRADAMRAQEIGNDLLRLLESKIHNLESGYEAALDPERRIATVHQMADELIAQINGAFETHGYGQRVSSGDTRCR